MRSTFDGESDLIAPMPATSDCSESRHSPSPPLAAVPAVAGASRGPVILIADDDTDARWILEDHLSYRGYVTIAAASGTASLILARDARPAVIVSELYLAAGGIPCLIHALKSDALTRTIPVIAYTSFVLDADAAWAASAPADVFLRKPAPPSTVAAIVEQLAGPPFAARRRWS